MQLAHHDPLGAINDEFAAPEHDRNVAEVDLFLNRLLASQPQQDPQRPAVGESKLTALVWIISRLTKFVPQILDLDRLIVALDRENLPEHALDPMILSLIRRHIVLQKCVVEPSLDFSQVRNRMTDTATTEVTDLGGLKTTNGTSCHGRKAPMRGIFEKH